MKGALSGLRKFLAAESPHKMMKNVFYFTLKLFSFSRNLNFCFDFSFIYCEIVSLETNGSNNILANIKGNQTMEFGQSIEYNMIYTNMIHKIIYHTQNMVKKLFSDPFLQNQN